MHQGAGHRARKMKWGFPNPLKLGHLCTAPTTDLSVGQPGAGGRATELAGMTQGGKGVR